jgi:hypothetical protein
LNPRLLRPEAFEGSLVMACLTIYPDAAHGFLFQHHEKFAADVVAFFSDEG